MNVLRMCWLGVATPEHEAMFRFLRDVLGLQVEFEEPGTAELSLPSGDRVQVLGPGHPTYRLFRDNANGPVALFEVDDLRSARAELEAAGIELVGELDRDDAWEWVNLRAPDGNLYELASRIHPT
jgi:catechol 2,3-dioxygenase-like lactoylglutathione lyase family enzyme